MRHTREHHPVKFRTCSFFSCIYFQFFLYFYIFLILFFILYFYIKFNLFLIVIYFVFLSSFNWCSFQFTYLFFIFILNIQILFIIISFGFIYLLNYYFSRVTPHCLILFDFHVSFYPYFFIIVFKPGPKIYSEQILGRESSELAKDTQINLSHVCSFKKKFKFFFFTSN
jgi:hypothetical protein